MPESYQLLRMATRCHKWQHVALFQPNNNRYSSAENVTAIWLSVRMPGLAHEAAVQLFRDNRDLAPFLLAAAGIPVEEGTASVADSDVSIPETGLALPKMSMVERRADVVTTVHDDATGKPLQMIITEVQASPPRPVKWWTWLVYMALVGRHHLCKVALLVVALSDRTAKGCGKGFESGHPGHRLAPGLISRHNVPDPGAPGAELIASQLTMLCVLTKKFDLNDPDTRFFVLEQLSRTDLKFRHGYTRIILKLADPAALHALGETMNTKFRVPLIDDPVDQGRAEGEARGEARGKATGKAEGIAEGIAKSLLFILDNRFTVPEPRRAQVTACTDADLLEEWMRRALSASSLEEVFNGNPHSNGNGNGNGARP